jgi:sterol 3beta-glucosyltransferase
LLTVTQDPYFPHGVVNLRYALSCEPAHEKDIRIRTNQKNISLSAESIASRDEWVKAIRRVIFKAQHTGDSVKVAIPYSAVLEVERSATLEDMIEVRVVDAAGRSVGDTYLFAHFTDRDAALKQIRTAVRAHSGSEQPRLVKDTTQPPRAPSNEPPPPPARPALGAFRLSSFWQRSGSTTTAPSAMPAVREQQPEEFTHISTRREGTFVPITTPEGGAPVEPTLTDSSHTYPPSPTPSETLGGASSALSTWGVGVPSWLRVTRPGAAHRSTSGMANAGSTSEVPAHERGYSVLETPAVPVDLEMQDKFRSYFALGEEEVLLGCEFFSIQRKHRH